MRTYVVRKKHTGEPATNGGQFGTHDRADATVGLTVENVEPIPVAKSSIVSDAPEITGERVTKYAVRWTSTGANYTPELASTDAIAPLAEAMLDAAVRNGELDSRLTYSVGTSNSGKWMTQRLIVTATIPRSIQLEFNEADAARTQHSIETEAVLSRIATAWQRKAIEPLSPYEEYNYAEEIRFLVAD
jgi:hypothetical protein